MAREGLDESKALYDWEYSKQLLYTQMLKEKVQDIIADASTLPEAIDRIMARFKLESPTYVVYGNGESRGHVDEDLEISDYGAAFSLFQEEFMTFSTRKRP